MQKQYAMKKVTHTNKEGVYCHIVFLHIVAVSSARVLMFHKFRTCCFVFCAKWIVQFVFK